MTKTGHSTDEKSLTFKKPTCTWYYHFLLLGMQPSLVAAILLALLSIVNGHILKSNLLFSLISDNNSEQVASNIDVGSSVSSTLVTNDQQSVTEQLVNKYKGKLLHCKIPAYPNCDLYLCGTLHVAESSCIMVKDVINKVSPSFVLLELCEARLDSLVEYDISSIERNLTLSDIFRDSMNERSIKILGTGLLTWMQLKAAKVTGNKLGGELATAARSGYEKGATLVLGDRLYAVTIQRIFDKLNFIEKVKLVLILFWEIITMSIVKLKDYIKKTENEVVTALSSLIRHISIIIFLT